MSSVPSNAGLPLPRVHPALPLQQVHRQRPTVAVVADEPVAGDAHAVEEHLAELVAARHRADLANLDARRVVVDQHHRQARGAATPACRCAAARRSAANRRLRRPDLVPVDDPVVAVAHRLRAQRGEVAPGVGFGEALTPRSAPRSRSVRWARARSGACTLSIGISVSIVRYDSGIGTRRRPSSSYSAARWRASPPSPPSSSGQPWRTQPPAKSASWNSCCTVATSSSSSEKH